MTKPNALKKHRAPKYWAVLMAAAIFAAVVVLTACPPETQTAQSQPPGPVISYCGIEGITTLTLVEGFVPQKLSADMVVLWSSSDVSTADVLVDGAIALKKETAANAPVRITATSDSNGAATSVELTILAAGTTPNIVVQNEADLRLMGCADGAPRLSATYTLANDITLTKEWKPIGDSNNEFSGTFDGAGHSIKNLVINKPGERNIGLISTTNSSSTIKNIGVELGDAGMTADGYSGALVGNNNGYVSGVVTGSGAINLMSGNGGGLVGINLSGTVVGYSSVAIKSAGGYSGGLVGYNLGGIIRGYATGNVSGTDGIGGLAGYSTGTVVGYYVGGTIQGDSSTGGLVGSVSGSGTLRGYSRGAVSVSANSTDVGKVVGLVANANATVNAYYSVKAGESVLTAPAGVTPNSVGDSIDASTKTALSDFTNFSTTNWDYVSGRWPAIKFPADQSIFNPYKGDKQPINPLVLTNSNWRYDNHKTHLHTGGFLMNDAKNRLHRAPKYLAVLLACAALLLAACPPESETTIAAGPQKPLISYCGASGITNLTLVMPSTTEKLRADMTVLWSSSDASTADVVPDGAIALKKATAANAPVLITATSGDGAATSIELTILAAGTTTTPNIVVHSEADLRLMGCADGVPRLGATYTLANDITLTKEWEPIGDAYDQFEGTLDGAGHTIKNLVINKPGIPVVGLIRFNSPSGRIMNIGVELGVAGVKGSGYTGALVGSNKGSVSGVVTGSGSINSSTLDNGGLVGINYNTGTVIGYSSIAIMSNGGHSAGLVGYNEGTVRGYATGNVRGTDSGIGGLVGSSSGTVVGYYVGGTIQYYVGEVKKDLGTGGLVGNTTSGTLTGYSRGAVSTNSSDKNIGRVVGSAGANATVNAYYSGKLGESTVTAPADVTPNSVGDSIDASTKTALSDFSGFVSNDWDYFSGRWPAIKFPSGQSIFDPYRGDKQPINP